MMIVQCQYDKARLRIARSNYAIRSTITKVMAISDRIVDQDEFVG
jgi:hypothetical protein